MSRQFAGSVYRGLKTATKRVMDSCGPLKVLASLSRIQSDSTLQRFGSQSADCADRFITVDVAVDFMKASGDFSLLEVMAYHLDMDVVAKPSTIKNPAKAAASQITGLAELIADLSVVAADGKITAQEIEDKDLVKDLAKVIKKAKRLKASLEQTLFVDAK